MKTDNQIRQDVMEEIEWDPMLHSTEIGVTVNNGIVTLSGHVNSYLKKINAEKAVKRVRDVKAVAIDLDVRLGFESQRNDTEIAKAAVDALKWNASVPDDKIKVLVDKGWVTLEGQVDWQYQKSAAERTVHAMTGVRGVSNRLTIKQTANPVTIKDRIRKALERNADIEAARIHIEADGNKVTLKGNVNSWNERKIAEQAAWSSPGVTAVEDNLMISFL